jgi:hypothetical protein
MTNQESCVQISMVASRQDLKAEYLPGCTVANIPLLTHPVKILGVPLSYLIIDVD